MPNERWNRLEHLFAEALELPLADRAAFLRRACGDDVALRGEIESLLSAHDSPGVLDVAPQSNDVPMQASLCAGARVGHWRIERLIGRGGMGEVYAATRADAAFEQQAALKLLRHEAVGQFERFHVERRILGRLEHPGIARLLDGGMAADGRPYTAMEYVEGQSLTQYCREHRLSLPARLALFVQVCDAVAFAHRNLIIHRDLKPDNILVNAEGRVKLLDFGIAKLLDAAAPIDDGQLTLAPFTPDYAAPEQLSGEVVTTATDIYALGVLLFELLTGERPRRMRGLPSTQALTLVLDRDAPPPSRVARANAQAPLPARRLAGDLDAIVAKCLRREAMHRYETVTALKDDIERHGRNEPVRARSGARAYIARRFLRRHWLPIAAVGVLVLAMGAAALYADAARRRTEQALHRADVVRDFVIDLFRQNDPGAGNSKSMSARELVDLGARRVESGFGDDADTRIELLGVTGNLYDSLGDYPRSGELLARRLDQATRAYAADDPRRIEAQLDMGVAHARSERFDAAQQLLRQALSSATAERAALQPLRARVLLALSDLEADRGNYQKAIEWSLLAIDLLQRVPAATAAERASALARYGLFTFRSGRIADAEAPLRQALAGLDVTNPDSVMTLLSVRLDLALVLTSLGRFDEAAPLMSANVASYRQLYGDRHPQLANALHQWGAVKRQSGDAKAAIPIFQESLAIYENTLGADHSFTATVLTSLGQALSADGQHKAAIEALARAHDVYVKTLGPSHAFTATSATALADARLTAGDFKGAEAGFRAALDSFDNVDDGKHIYAEAARLGLGHTLAAESRCAEAEAPLRQAKDRFVKEFGADDRRAIDAATSLVHCLIQTGQREAARSLLEESEQALARSRRDVTRSRPRVDAARREFDL